MKSPRLSRKTKPSANLSPSGPAASPPVKSIPSASRAAVRLSQPGDASERAADRMAHQALAGHGPASPVRTSAEGAGGEPLPADVRRQLEPGFGADLGGVRVHRDPAAAAASESVGARAFTLGGDIAFGAGEFQPGTAHGRELIAHEVAHTLQPEAAAGTDVVHRQPGGATAWTPLVVPRPDPLQLSYADLQHLEDQRREPVRRWLDAHLNELLLLSNCALRERVRAAVPEGERFADLELDSILHEWAESHSLSIPRVSAIPQSCESIPSRSSGPSLGAMLADSDLAGIVSGAISLATDGVDVASDEHGRVNISLGGMRVELNRGVFRVAGTVGFTGGFAFDADAGPFHFHSSLGSDRWEMSLSFGTRLPARLNDHLRQVFTDAEASLRHIATTVGTGDPAVVKAAVESEMQRVKDALNALSRAAAIAGPHVSVGVGAVGPGLGTPGPGTPPGTAVEATLTVWF